jgi:hypothetical protein
MSTEETLINLSGFKPKKKYADRQEYLTALATAIDKLDDDAFDDPEFTDEAMGWFKAAVEAITNGEEIPDFDEEVEPEAEPDDEGDEDGEETENSVDEAGGEGEDEEATLVTVPDEDAVVEVEEAPEAEETVVDEPAEESEPVEEPKKAGRPKAPKKEKLSKEEFSKNRQWSPARITRTTGEKDRYGIFEGTKLSEVAKAFEQGVTMAELKKEYNDTFYGLMKRLIKEGHLIEKNEGVITLTHKDDVKPRSKAKSKAKPEPEGEENGEED